jgi:hypothetical protein
VIWSADLGTITSPGGLYSAPCPVTAPPPPATVKACSTAAPLRCGVATVTLGPTLTVAGRTGPAQALKVKITADKDNDNITSGDTPFALHYDNNAVVTLTALQTVTVASVVYAFADWSGCDTRSGFTCTVTVSADKLVTALYNPPRAPIILPTGYRGPPVVVGGSSAVAQMEMSSPAPSPDGLTVSLKSSSTKLTVPAGVHVPAGATLSDFFTMTTTTVTTDTPVTITATYQGNSTTAIVTVQPANDFSIGISPPSQTMFAGTTKQFTVTTAVTRGAAQAISLSVSGLPAGVTGAFSPGSVTAGGSSTLTLTASAIAANASNDVFTVKGTASSGNHTVDATISVVANGFSMSISPASQTVVRSASGQYNVCTALTAGQSQAVSLSITGLPGAVTSSFSPASLTTGQCSTLTLSASASATLVTNAVFTVKGTAPSGFHTTTATITVTPAVTIVISPATLPGGTVNASYFQTLTASGGAAPYGFSLSSGTLPAGLAISGSGVISGIPTSGGSSTFSIKAVDSLGRSGTRTYTMGVVLNDAAVVSAMTAVPGTMTTGETATATITMRNTGSTTWTTAAGYALADVTSTPGQFGITRVTLTGSVSASAQISLTFSITAPSTPGTYPFIWQMRQDPGLWFGAYAPSLLSSITVTAPVPIVLSPTILPNGTVGTEYNQAVTATGGTAPYTFSLVPGSGFLPAGLILSGSGSIFGVPTAAGSSIFSIKATDSQARSGTRNYTVVVIGNDFSVSVSPSSQSVDAGLSTSFSVSTAVTSGQAQTITLAVTGLGSGATGGFTPLTVTAGQSSTLSISTTSSAAQGSFVLTVTGIASSGNRTATTFLIVNPPRMPIVRVQRVLLPPRAEGGTSFTGTVEMDSAAPAGGLTVGLTSSSPGVASVPVNVFVPGQATVSLPFTVTTTVVPASTSVTITASYQGSSVSATFTVDPRNDFSISISPSTQSVDAGLSTSYTVSTAVTSGQPQTITLSISGLGSGATPAFTPSSVSAGGTATLAISTTSAAAQGLFHFTVTGTASSGSHAAQTYLVVNPPRMPIIRVQGVVIPPRSAGGTSFAGTVEMNSPAPAGGLNVDLTSSSPTVASVASPAFVPSGASISLPFTVTTAVVPISTQVTITAAYAGSSATASFFVDPLASVSIAWVQPADAPGSFGEPGTLTVAGYAQNGTGSVALSWRDATLGGSWNTVAYQAPPGAGNVWYNTIPNGNSCHVYEVQASYSGATTPVFTYNGPALGFCVIQVQAATYGGNCGAPHGNATWSVAPSCDYTTSCDYTVDYHVLGDPVGGCAKDFVVEWTCGFSQTGGGAYVPPEAGNGSVVHLRCP